MEANHGSLLTVPYDAWVNEYHGHRIEHLDAVFDALTSGIEGTQRPLVFLAGDSSLDNKNWFPPGSKRPACNGYEHIVDPPYTRPDVSWALNSLFASQGARPGTGAGEGSAGATGEIGTGTGTGEGTGEPASGFACINAAVEESTLGQRKEGRLLPHDAWIRSHIRPQDVLIVSLGGNDIALAPSPGTMLAMGSLTQLASDEAIDNGTAMGLGHFTTLFRDDVSAYITSLTSTTRPALVIVCMIYYPHEAPGGSWADGVLGLLGYNSKPGRLQHLIRKVYELGTCAVRVPGIRIIPCPLFTLLDASSPSMDYLQRVEPSEQGGKKMAQAFAGIIAREYGKPADDAASAGRGSSKVSGKPSSTSCEIA